MIETPALGLSPSPERGVRQRELEVRQETFWSERFGMVVDRFGIPWMINCETPGG